MNKNNVARAHDVPPDAEELLRKVDAIDAKVAS